MRMPPPRLLWTLVVGAGLSASAQAQETTIRLGNAPSIGPGSVSTYEVGKVLETQGLTLADVDIKVIPFQQYSIAFANKAIDAALAITPFTSQLRDRGLAIPFADTDALIRPAPMTISVNMINTDWAARN